MKAKQAFFKLLTINYVVFVVAGFLIYPVLVVLVIFTAAIEAMSFFYSQLKDAPWRLDLSKNNFKNMHKHWRKKYEK